jgi:hypothetical protein
MAKCPGQDQRFWKPKDIFEISCPHCSRTVEFWKDDPQVKCSGCKKMITNPKLDISCAKWCKYAKECLGVSSANSDNVLCNTLVEDMKKICVNDQQRIDHAAKALHFAEQIQPHEGGDPLIVKAAAILRDADMRTNSDESHEPVMARDVLEKHGIDAKVVEQIALIIAALQDEKEIDSVEFRIVFDAELLAKSENGFGGKSKEEIDEAIDKTFKTNQGKLIAKLNKSLVASS